MTDRAHADLTRRFSQRFDELAAIGRDQRGGWTRLAWTASDRQARAWFERSAEALGLNVEVDRNGIQWAWWGQPADGAVATGSHLDTVPSGGAYDGALGVVSGLLAVEELRRRGSEPARPIVVVAFPDEEGGRFNTPTFASRLLTGELDPATVLDRRDVHGERLADAVAGFGLNPEQLGPDKERLRRLGAFVELHVEQGRGLVQQGTAVALCDQIWPHGRWRLTIEGEANHAGTTRLEDRRDPMLPLAAATSEARALAASTGSMATLGRVEVLPNAANSIPARVRAWLDARAATESDLHRLMAGWEQAVRAAAGRHHCELSIELESSVPGVAFDTDLTGRLARLLGSAGRSATVLPTAAGHDAGVLAPHVPSAMLFVRNPTGVSHSPREHATTADCVAGVSALADVLEALACR